MPPTEHSYREMQKMNENLRRENHLLRLLDDLYRENPGLKGEASFCSGSGSQEKGDEKETEVEAQVTKELSQGSSWNGSDNTLRGDGEDREDGGKGTAGTEALNERTHEKGGEEEAQDNDTKTREDSKISKNKDDQPEEEKEKEEEEEYDDTNASGSESDPEWRCACNDENEFYETSDVEESESESESLKSESDSESEEDYDVDPTSKYSERNRILSAYKEHKLGLSGHCPTALGESKLDAGLYMASGLDLELRTDVSVYTSLYGLHPAIVAWIGESLPVHSVRFSVCPRLITSDTPDYEPTISLLDRHAEFVLLRSQDGATDFFKKFQSFVKVLEEADFPSGYFEDDDAHASEHCRAAADAHMACVATLHSV